MSDKALRLLIAAVISLLIIYQIGTLVGDIFGMVWGLTASIIVAVVSFISVRLAKAGGKSSIWFLLPTVLFTVIPIIIMLWRVFTNEATWVDRFTSFGPFVVGFGLPIVILFLVYFELRKRTINEKELV